MHILNDNSFPVKLTEQLIKEIKQKIQQEEINEEQKDNIGEPTIFHSVKYIPRLTDNRTLKSTINDNKICFAYKPNSTLSAVFSNVKTPIEKHQQNNLVYEIQCKGNEGEECGQVYIGTTKRALKVRMGEHKMDIEKRSERTALSQHVLHSGHVADFENVRVLDRENKGKKRYMIESLRIQQRHPKAMNLKSDTDNISASYRVAITDL